MSAAEIAAHEQLAIGTVKSRVARALAELREALRQS
jgi:DNA-directed RNA polymerase specialized sigma24 family protein